MVAEQKQTWQNQSQFLQDRHGPGKARLEPEVIVVALPTCNASDRRNFDLLCWTINMAARPRDSITTLHPQNFDVTQESLAGYACNSHAVNPQMKPLQDLCDVKQVHLEMRVMRNEVTGKMLAEEVSAMKATMLVVTTLGHHSLRFAQRRGNFLCRHVLAGCSIVVVRDYKVLFYQDNHYRANFTQRMCILTSEDGSPNDYLASMCIETPHQPDAALTSCNKIWPDSAGRSLLRRAPDSSDAFYGSDDSSGVSIFTGLTRSLSRKAFVSSPSSLNTEGDHFKSNGCLSIWRERGRVHRLLAFPSSRQPKRTLVYTHWKSLGNSLKSYMNTLWIARPLKKGSVASTAIVRAGTPCKIFTYEEISKATNLFSSANLVGKGGHSEVYKGLLFKDQFVAVKRLLQGDTEERKIMDFLTELGMICHTSHPNITPLVGFCIEKGLHLVFQFVRHGSLALWLHGGKLPTLKWATRYKVAVGTARGLKYLHADCQRRVIHRDIKASNILLGADFEPQISDFGLAKWLPNQCSQQIKTPIEGTFGYLAPEYFMHGLFDEKTDVFAFGVLLLELVTGRKPIESMQSNLVMWARPFLEAMDVEKLTDVRLNGEYDSQELQCVMMAAALCVQQSPQCRPSMSQVLQLLTDEMSTEGADSLSVLSSHSFCFQDLIFDSDYSSAHYHNDMRRHREIALQL